MMIRRHYFSGGFRKSLEEEIVGFTRFFKFKERLDLKKIETGIRPGVQANGKPAQDALHKVIPQDLVIRNVLRALVTRVGFTVVGPDLREQVLSRRRGRTDTRHQAENDEK